ncbi:unnamed protein product [Rhizophagus irregularis]|nr:unnamed protein product [Rhizophagus irregularis]
MVLELKSIRRKDLNYMMRQLAVISKLILLKVMRCLVNDLDKVNYWYHKAAENDDKFALYKLGEFNELGKGIGKNKVRAFEFYKKSANQGFIDAHYKLGCCYEYGIGTDIDKGKAFDSYKMAAEGGNFDAQKSLAYLYEHGEKTGQKFRKCYLLV